MFQEHREIVSVPFFNDNAKPVQESVAMGANNMIYFSKGMLVSEQLCSKVDLELILIEQNVALIVYHFFNLNFNLIAVFLWVLFRR